MARSCCATRCPTFRPGCIWRWWIPRSGGIVARSRVRTAEEDRLLVGPDNGLLSLAAERFGGAVEAADVGRSRWRLQPVSATFHGRDIFAPVAARLAAGEPLAEAGDPCDPDDLVRIALPSPEPRRRRADRPRPGDRPVRQRPARRHPRGPRGLRTAPRPALRAPGRAAAIHRLVRGDLRRRAPGRAARVRGRLPNAGGRRQPRQRGLAAGARARRRAADRGGVSATPSARPLGPLGRPRLHLRAIDSTNARARELAAAGAPPRNARHRRGADGGPGAPGAQLDGAARGARC